ncbi:glycine betaine ABC transporter ATP-binding protein [Oceanidesulfovibrio indonesiensis]|uniref:Glycine betaine ABC transporter ATP-binding protein n=1 Tax=Oceanidesulfovibrio indonesiensis TaxID=54767 RepID=A0A7M3MAR9_9BACT|nr:ABC transporter ATP-binding protein [Oceanidesulfovibrio indonesiensis]TVM15020.1 glycine betaine ABC transporter ATP-binding protein [Oceanidesulfovibrio indonesiensis]
MIRLEGVGKRYGGEWAVRDLDLTMERGEFCCLIGPSGCGKSTTLKMINRMVEATSGTIAINGRDVRSMKQEELRRGIGYVIQSIGLFPHMTVEANIGVVPHLLGWDKVRTRTRSLELLELLGLAPDEYAHKYPRELSGGQAQRVGVARALAGDPDILLMDEPFGALDPITREHLQGQFAAIQQELQKTVVFVTHDIDEAVRLGNRVALMRDGRLVQVDSPETLLSEPKDSFVKKFVGLDRALKRLSRLRVQDFVRPAQSVPDTISAEELRGRFHAMHGEDCARYMWVTDDRGGLLGWIDSKSANGVVSVQEDMVRVDANEMAVQADFSLKQALSLFVQQGVVCLPVLDKRGKFNGEVRLADVLES